LGIFNEQRPAPSPAQGFVEHFRREADGQVADTQYQLVSRDDAYAYQGQQGSDQSFFWGGAPSTNGRWIGRSYYPNQGWQASPPPQPAARGFFQLFGNQAPPRPSGDYFWGGRLN
jgi:hypothetical protein